MTHSSSEQPPPPSSEPVHVSGSRSSAAKSSMTTHLSSSTIPHPPSSANPSPTSLTPLVLAPYSLLEGGEGVSASLVVKAHKIYQILMAGSPFTAAVEKVVLQWRCIFALALFLLFIRKMVAHVTLTPSGLWHVWCHKLNSRAACQAG